MASQGPSTRHASLLAATVLAAAGCVSESVPGGPLGFLRGALLDVAVPVGLLTSADEAVAWADWDADGDLDLAVGGIGVPLRVYENTAGQLLLAWSSPDIDETHALAWGDIDGDLLPDLAVAVGTTTGGDGIDRVLQNQGGAIDGTLLWESLVSEDTLAIALADVDGDGDLDLATGAYSNGGTSSEGVSVYLNTGTTIGTIPSWAPTSSPAIDAVSIAFGQVSGSSLPDLAVADATGAARVYENGGSGWFDESNIWYSGSSHPTFDVALADLDGDGDLDLVTAGRRTSSIVGGGKIYRNHGAGLHSLPG